MTTDLCLVNPERDMVPADRWDRRFLRGLDRDVFTGRLAYYLGEVNALHPFREGNGRAKRTR